MRAKEIPRSCHTADPVIFQKSLLKCMATPGCKEGYDRIPYSGSKVLSLLIKKKVRMNIRAESHQSVSACQLDAYSNTNSSSGLLLFFFILSSPTLSWMKVQSNETLLSFTLHHVTSTTTVMNWEDKRYCRDGFQLRSKKTRGNKGLFSFLISLSLLLFPHKYVFLFPGQSTSL